MRIRTSIVFRDLEDLKTFSSGSFPFDLWGVNFRNDHHVQKCLFAILSKSTAALSYHKYPPASFPSTRPWGFGKRFSLIQKSAMRPLGRRKGRASVGHTLPRFLPLAYSHGGKAPCTHLSNTNLSAEPEAIHLLIAEEIDHLA